MNCDRYVKHYLCWQTVELISAARMGSASTFNLSFGYRVHNLNAGQKEPGTAKIFESRHGARASLDHPMVHLDNSSRTAMKADLSSFYGEAQTHVAAIKAAVQPEQTASRALRDIAGVRTARRTERKAFEVPCVFNHCAYRV